LYWSIERVIKAERDLLRTGLDIADSLEFDVAAAIKVPSDMHESGRIVLDELIAALKELERQGSLCVWVWFFGSVLTTSNDRFQVYPH
jgi:hypothetical protein